jgi:acyl-CoA hydrolase
MHGVAAFPSVLASALNDRKASLSNIEINHLHIESANPCSGKPFFIDNYFIGKNQRKQVEEGRSSLIPCFLSELPKLMRSGTRKPRVAFLNLSEPDKHGFCSLGVESCTAYAAAETCDVIVAQINPNVPRTHGQTFVHYNSIDLVVSVNQPLPEYKTNVTGPIETAIGNHIANLIPNNSTLQMGIGSIPNAVLSCLTNHQNLGIHTEMFSDGVIPLVEKGIITNSHKKIHRDKLVTSFVMGKKSLYDFVDDNPSIFFGDIQRVNDPHEISKNNKVVAINSAIEIDLTGQVCADSVGMRMISGVGGQVDFERGAALSRGFLQYLNRWNSNYLLTIRE